MILLLIPYGNSPLIWYLEIFQDTSQVWYLTAGSGMAQINPAQGKKKLYMFNTEFWAERLGYDLTVRLNKAPATLGSGLCATGYKTKMYNILH